jgi:hypothetical protein
LENGGHRLVPAPESGGVAISSLFEDSAGRIWIGGNESIACFETGEFRRVSLEGGGLIPGGAASRGTRSMAAFGR